MPPEAFFTKIGASSEERERFEAFDEAFLETAEHTNLVARATLPERWSRHYFDSAQIFDLVPLAARRLLDIGSGGGFPIAVLAILALHRRPDLDLTAIDSVGKKTAFLARAARGAGLHNLTVLTGRVERTTFGAPFDVITARAVTALDGLLGLAVPRLSPDGLLILPKGRRAQQELDAARERWSFDLETRPSRTDSEASILLIRSPQPSS